MRKKSGFTIVEQAIMLVPEFEKVVRKLDQQVTMPGQSKSTLQNYIRRIWTARGPFRETSPAD
jgi:integrase/recombinase XerD